MIRKLIALLVVFAVVATTMAGPVKVIAFILANEKCLVTLETLITNDS